MVPVVPHHVIAAGLDPKWRVVAQGRRRILQDGVGAPIQHLHSSSEGIAHRIDEGRVQPLAIERHSIHLHDPTGDLDQVPGDTDDPLHEAVPQEIRIPVRRVDLPVLPRHLEDDHIRAPRLAKAREPPIGEGNLRTVQELVHEEVITDEQGGKHRLRRDAEWLDHQGADSQGDQHRDADRRQLIANRGRRFLALRLIGKRSGSSAH